MRNGRYSAVKENNALGVKQSRKTLLKIIIKDFIKDCYARDQDYCNRGEKWNLTLLKKKAGEF